MIKKHSFLINNCIVNAAGGCYNQIAKLVLGDVFMIKACVIGLGQRGHMLTRDVLLKIDKLEIVSVCDVYEDRIERTLETLKNAKSHQNLCSFP